MRRLIVILLNSCLCLVLAAGLVSLLDDSLALGAGVRSLSALSGALTLVAALTLFLVYLLMGVTLWIPKRIFLPIVLLLVATILAILPVLIYFPHRLREADWIASVLMLAAGLMALARLQWRLVDEKALGERWFSVRNSLFFLAANLFIGLPGIVTYAALCLALAISHYSDGFLALRPDGLSVQARKYVRADGKSIELVPMLHVGDAGFYSTVSRSFPTNAVILMEGVSDRQRLLTNGISYKRMAKSLGLSEQRENFAPPEADLVFADVDVAQFNTNTIGFLNLVMLVHSQGLNSRTLEAVFDYTPPPHFEDQLIEDLLRKRNQHVLDELHTRLLESDDFILPWGAAHMPGLARQIQKDGFRVKDRQDLLVIRFFGR